MTEEKKNVHKGHRQKIKERYLTHGIDTMPDHAVLEMMLFFAVPYRDTNELAHRLMDRFGSFSAVLEASASDLAEVEGVTENVAALLTLFLPVFGRYNDSLIKDRPVITSSEQAAELLRPKFLPFSEEKVCVMGLDGTHRLLFCDVLGEGSVENVFLDMRRLARRALDGKVRSLILAHNHPGFVAAPSGDDIDLTVSAFRLLSQLGVSLEDHIILSDDGCFSMAGSEKFKHIFVSGE